MIVTQGSYQVIGNLGYISDTVNNVVVVVGQTTEDVDLTLEALPTRSLPKCNRSLGGSGDVTEVEVVAGYHVVNPDDGNYIMEIEIGLSYDVTAQLADYLPEYLDTG